MEPDESIREDIEHVRRIANGDQTAENRLCQKYYKKILFFVRRRLSNQEEVNDLSQQIMLEVLLAARNKKIKKPEKLPSFIYKICQRRVTDKIRKNYRRKETPLEQTTDQSNTPFPIQIIYSNNTEDRVEIWTILKKLNVEEKVILKLSYIFKWTSQEIGDLLDISDASVRQKKKQILDKLRKNI